jgi:hypothetical protein
MRHLFILCLIPVALPVWAQAPGKGAPVICCSDGGHQICADVLPPQCFGKSYREMGAQGTVRRLVEAPLTPEQLARREVEERARRAEVARQRAELRRNQALLETYSSVADIDSRRDRAIEAVEIDLKQAENRYAQLAAKRQDQVREAEFYQKRAMPPLLSASLRESDSELALQNALIEAKRRDIEAIRARFEQDRSRYIALTEAHTQIQPPR